MGFFFSINEKFFVIAVDVDDIDSSHILSYKWEENTPLLGFDYTLLYEN